MGTTTSTQPSGMASALELPVRQLDTAGAEARIAIRNHELY